MLSTLFFYIIFIAMVAFLVFSLVAYSKSQDYRFPMYLAIYSILLLMYLFPISKL